MESQQQMTYSQSASAAGVHGKALIRSTIGAHPVTTAAVMGVLVVLVLIMMYHSAKSRSASKAGFGISPVNNLNTGGMNSMWYLGSGDAGWGGSLHREATNYGVGAYVPGMRANHIGRRLGAPNGVREGLATSPDGTPIDLSTSGANPGPCAAGMTPVTYQNPDGSLLTRCVSSGPSVVGDPSAILSACGQTWDPAATAEAQALATVGSFQHDSYGERKLQNAINAAFDSNVGLTDDQLAQVMAGGAP
jgi:hypothetical protein